jgi:serine/threonine protein phosphatase 1
MALVPHMRKISKNTNGRDFVIGDIHGCYELLMEYLTFIKFDFNKDRLFSVGDLVNKGDDSLAIFNLIDEPWFYPILGNHEMIVIDFWRYGDYPTHLNKYGGEWFLNLTDDEKEAVVLKLETLPVAIELEVHDKRIGIIHAEVPNDNWKTFEARLKNTKGMDNFHAVNEAVWTRTKHDYRVKTKIKNIDYVYVGHTIVRQPLVLGNVFYIDTGAFCNEEFTIVNLTDIYST